MVGGERDSETERETDRPTDRQRKFKVEICEKLKG